MAEHRRRREAKRSMSRFDPGRLRAAATMLPEEGIRLQDLLELAPGGQLPVLIMLCTLPAALPGLQLGWVCVPVLLYLAASLWRGEPRPRLPSRLTQSVVSRAAATRLLRSFAWMLEKFGRHCRSTCPAFVRRIRRKPAAVLVAAMSLVILLPLPASNVVPALSIFALMAGLLWRDARAVAASLVLACVGVLLVGALAWGTWAAAAWFL